MVGSERGSRTNEIFLSFLELQHASLWEATIELLDFGSTLFSLSCCFFDDTKLHQGKGEEGRNFHTDMDKETGTNYTPCAQSYTPSFYIPRQWMSPLLLAGDVLAGVFLAYIMIYEIGLRNIMAFTLPTLHSGVGGLGRGSGTFLSLFWAGLW